MKLGTGGPDSQAEAMADFLAEHAAHAKGFQTDYPGGVGSGRIVIRCKGCGAEIERSSDDSALGLVRAAHEPEPEAPPASSPPPRPRRARPAPPPPPPPPPPANRRPLAPASEPLEAARPRPRIGTAVLAAIAVISGGVAIARIAGGGGGSSQSSTPEPAQTQTPAPAPAPAAKPPPSSSGAQTGRTVSGPHYSLRLPQGWTKSVRDGAVVLAPAGSRDVEVRLFYDESSALSLEAMLASTADLLRRQHPGAEVSPPSREGGDPDRVTLTARYSGVSETATVVSAGDFRLLLLTRIDEDASGAERAAAESVLASLKTR
jgi:hypothetical protein